MEATIFNKKFRKTFRNHNNEFQICYKKEFYDSGISLPAFPSITNLKLHNISVTTNLVKKVITNLDSSKMPGTDFIPVVVLKNCEPKLSYKLTELFYVSEEILFSTLLERLICDSCI